MTATIEVEQGNNEPIDDTQDQDRSKKARLSVVSRKYDLDGDGVLDEAEQAMRNLDKSGRGFLKSEEVYDIMNQHLKMQKDMFKMKKVLGGLIAFTFLLTLSNLGTSLAAAWLSKDTATSNGSFVDKKTSQTLSTQQQKEKFFAQPINEERRRELTAGCTADGKGNNHVNTHCVLQSFLEVPHAQGQQIIDHCYDGKIVAICRDFQFDGNDQTINVCKNMCGNNIMSFEATHNGRNGNNRIWLEGKADVDGDGTHDATITCDSHSNGMCVIAGSHFQQGETEKCDVNHDCKEGLECVGVDNTCAEPLFPVDPEPECSTNEDCNDILGWCNGECTPECWPDGTCQARINDSELVDPKPVDPEPECSTNADCKDILGWCTGECTPECWPDGTCQARIN